MEEQAIDKELLDKKASLAGIVCVHNMLKFGCFQVGAFPELDKALKFMSSLYNTAKEDLVKHPDAEKDPDIKALIDADKAAAAPPVVPEVV